MYFEFNKSFCLVLIFFTYHGVYQAWCKARNFASMLPDDTKASRAAALETLLQTQVNAHFKVADPNDKPIPFSDELFKEAAIQWLIETDQVCTSSCLSEIYSF